MGTYALDVDIFTERVDEWIRLALERQPQSFGALLRTLPGVDPAVVADCLERVLSNSGEQLSTRARAGVLLLEAETPLPDNNPSRRPIPHPLDCYWPNDPLTLRALTRKLARLTPAGGKIIYLAWPNAFADARALLPNRKHLLLERDSMRAAAHRGPAPNHDVLTIDVLRDALPADRADTIIADPPWYPEELMAFLWAAAQLAKPGAHVLLALPQIGTRPGIDLEREDVMAWAALCGLRSRELCRGVLGYLAPPFERAALAARGLPGTPSNWRRGDLLICVATPTELPPRPHSEADRWHGTHLNGIPIRVRVENSAEFSTSISAAKLLESAVNGDVLDTVSRRAAIRQRARVWTSRNRVFTSTHPGVLLAILNAIPYGLPAEQAAEKQLGRALADNERGTVIAVSKRLDELAERELREHGLR